MRLIGMDTPEVYFGTQPYRPEASAFAKRQLDGEEVKLELDVRGIDPYDRLLAYVYLPNGQMFNETLVREGYAQPNCGRRHSADARPMLTPLSTPPGAQRAATVRNHQQRNRYR